MARRTLVVLACVLASSVVASAKNKPSLRPPLEKFVGQYEGVCVQKVAGTIVNGELAPECLGKGELMALPYFVNYTKNSRGYQMSWMELSSNVTSAAGGWWYLPGSSATSTTLSIKHAKDSKTQYCISGKFMDGTSATFRASVQRVGQQFQYVEEGIYNATTAATTNLCPAKDNAPLFCNAQLVSYRCVATRVP